MRRFLGLWILVLWKRPDEMYQIPAVLLGFYSSKCGHATQADAVLHDPEELSVGILRYAGRSEVSSQLIHTSPRIGWFSAELPWHSEQSVSISLAISRSWSK